MTETELATKLLREVIGGLDAAGIPHMLVGSFASTSYSTPRTTQDIDIVIDPTPLALDLKDNPFGRSEFDRRVWTAVFGVDLFIATAEDTVLAKLEWAAMGASDRQVADAAAVLAVQGDRIDDAYLDRWATELGVTDLLERARKG